jgi:hypothetical protein
MRRNDKAISDPHIIREILRGSQICRIAMIDGDMPYIVPLNYGYDDHALYFHAAPEGRKIDLIRKNSRVCFEIEEGYALIRHEEPCGWTSRYRSVIGYGKIEILTGLEEKISGLDRIMAHHGHTGHSQYPKASLEKMVILRLTIEQLTAKQSGY